MYKLTLNSNLETLERLTQITSSFTRKRCLITFKYIKRLRAESSYVWFSLSSFAFSPVVDLCNVTWFCCSNLALFRKIGIEHRKINLFALAKRIFK